MRYNLLVAFLADIKTALTLARIGIVWDFN